VIRLLVVDDHPVVRTGLAQLLELAEDVELVGTADDGEIAVALAREASPDVVLMDLEMPGMDGIQATARIRAAGDGAQVVALTSFSDRERILGALDAGAVGYLLKDADPAELLRGIRAAAKGDSPLAPKAASALLSAREQRPAADLTPREREVLAQIAEGRSNGAIAESLVLTKRAVEKHINSIFLKLGLGNAEDVSKRVKAALMFLADSQDGKRPAPTRR
jgi:DNA-binding NarL/FixJ family response regulator